MNRKRTGVLALVALLSSVGVTALSPQPDLGAVALRESVRQYEEQFVSSVFRLYADAVMGGNQHAPVILERFFDVSAMDGFSVRSFQGDLSFARLDSIASSSGLPVRDVTLDMMAVLYAADLLARRESGEGVQDIGPVFYDQADVPMTVLNEINRTAIEAMEPAQRDAVLLRIQEVDQNRAALTTRRQAAEIRPRLLLTAGRLHRKYLAAVEPEQVVGGIARRTEGDPAVIQAWLVDLDALPSD